MSPRLRVAYSIAADLGTGSTGAIARREAEAFSARAELVRVFASGGTADLAPGVLQRVPLPWVPGLGRLWSGKRFLWWARAAAFDHRVARQVPPCDLFYGWAGQSLATMRAARAAGAWCAIERGNAHILDEVERHARAHQRQGIAARSLFDTRRWIERSLAEYAEADQIVVPSKFVLESFLGRGVPRNRLLLAPLAVDHAAFPAGGWPRPGPFTVVFVGRVAPNKGVDLLVDAFRAAQMPDARLRILGGRSPLMRRVPGGDDPRIEWAGGLPRARVAAALRTAHVAVFPSLEDGFGLVVLEAMASGTSVLVSRSMGAADWVRPGTDGDTFEAEDRDALVAGLRGLYDDRDQAAAWGRAAAERVQGATWARYVELLWSALEARRAGGPTGACPFPWEEPA